MQTVTRNVRDLDQSERSIMERVVGCRLQESQQITVNIVTISSNIPALTVDELGLAIPEHWKIYEGLSETEVEELDREIRQRANLTRHVE